MEAASTVISSLVTSRYELSSGANVPEAAATGSCLPAPCFAASSDQYGGHISYPLVSDVQDESLCQQLQQELGLQLADAQHLAQAISNDADIFLTCDTDFLDEPKHRKPRRKEHTRTLIEKTYPLKLRRPSELVADLDGTMAGG
jgi:hypothetical protein